MTSEETRQFIQTLVSEAMDRQRETVKDINGSSAEPPAPAPTPLSPPVKTALNSDADSASLLRAILTGAVMEKKAASSPGQVLGGMCRALAAAKRLDYGSGSHLDRARDIAKDLHKDDTVAKALQLSQGEDGGYLVSPEHLPEVIEYLRAASVFRQLNPTVIPLINGAASISKLTGGATAYYVGESSNITPSQPTTGLVNFSAKKLAALVPVSNDLLRVPMASANTVVEQDLRGAVGEKSDYTFIRGTGTAYSPRGIENLCLGANKDNMTGPATLATVTVDLGNMVLHLLENNVRMLRPGWLFAPRTFIYLATIRDGNGNYAYREELLRGFLWGFPYRFTSQIPVNLGGGTESKVYIADFADVVLAEEMSLELVASSDAAYWDGSAVVAAFSRDETVIRAIMKHDLNTRHEESIAILEQVTWGA